MYWKMLIYFMTIWSILQSFGIFYDHLVHFVFMWYIFPVLVSCTKENLATLFAKIICITLSRTMSCYRDVFARWCCPEIKHSELKSFCFFCAKT
jgi:hypothetical protein